MIVDTEQQVRDLLVWGRITTNDAGTLLMFREFLERVGPPGSNPQAERELLAEPQWREFIGVEAVK